MMLRRNLSFSSGLIPRPLRVPNFGGAPPVPSPLGGGWFCTALIAVAVLGASCSRETRVDCVPVAMVDSVGERSEQIRVEFQWLAVRFGMDSALRTPEGIQAHRSAALGLDSSIARYRDSMRTEGTGVVSKSGCLDWKATWEVGRLDRSALVTSFLRALVRDSSSVMEWTASDAIPGELRLHAIYAVPGPDGGSVDSAVLRLEPKMVSVAPR